ncbi:hypothetical protein NQ318_011223 [Aromia moschata]|uniref:Peptidase S1 domain-containing protein n=1 Tax=Aromia moschata TaxID=1265417 RepID=A0AAV8YHL4_9CUCU|nr:hypothetical protein NQ318_011223 [Aromia moschata]
MDTLLKILVITLVLRSSSALPYIDWSKVGPNILHVNANGFISHINGTSRIINGHEVTPNSVPYMAAVRPDGVGFCGASFIAPTWALTAAHCVDTASYTLVVLGAHRVLQSEQTQIVVPSRSIILHPGWNPQTLLHDVALVHLQQTVPQTSIIRPIPLAPVNSGTFAGSTGYLTGWGYTSDTSPTIAPTLQGIHLRIISTQECSQYVGQWAYETNVCTYGSDGNINIGACYGDSGSPLVVDGVQIGIASFIGNELCAAGSITSYARISSYVNWINQHIYQ